MSILKKNYTVDELLDRYLPKYPQMLFTGDSITPEQALEVIRRTDTFFTRNFLGNNHEFVRDLKKKVGMPAEPSGLGKEYIEYEDNMEAWKNSWSCVRTEYVQNSWISCADIYGPHGWCHPDGKLGYEDNIGKSPTGREVYKDLVTLAEAFPFLRNVGVTLMSEGKDADPEFGIFPVMSFSLHEGVVKVLNPNKHDVHDEHEEVPCYNRPCGTRECALTQDQIDLMLYRKHERKI